VTGTGVLMCRPLNEQIATMPGCVPGAITNIGSLLTSGPIGNRLSNYLNPNFVSTAQLVPFGATGATGFGNVPRNAFRGPRQENWDFSLIKNIRIAESHQFTARMDVFNLWNHPIFRFPSTVQTATPASFGQITETAVPSRLIQFGLTYRH
jgi:hypothetical protein